MAPALLLAPAVFAQAARPDAGTLETAAALSVLAPADAGTVDSATGLVKSLTLPEALALAEKHNPDYRSTGYDVVAAQGAVIQASVLPNPTLGVASFARTFNPLQGPVPNFFSLGWTIPIGGKIGAATDAAQASLDAAKATREAARRQLVINVQSAFVTVQLQMLLASFAEKDQAGFHKELDLNEIRYKDGKISFGELLKLRIQAVSTDDEVRESKEQLANARAELQHVIGEGILDDDFEVQGDLAVPAAPGMQALNGLLQKALEKRPDYQALIAQEKSAGHALSLARRTPIPDLGVAVDYNRALDDSSSSYDLSLSVAVPIFDRNQGNITQAEAALEKAKLAQSSLRTQVRADLTKALQEWQAASGLLAAYQGGVVDEAKESLDIAKHAYDLGTGTLLDYLDAEASYRQVESAYRASLARTAMAVQNIQFITGEVQQ